MFKVKIINPNNIDGPKVNAVFHEDYIDHLRDYPVDFENLEAVVYVLKHPERIFRGIRQIRKGGWCYTGTPKKFCVAEKVTAPFPKGFVLGVYMNPNMNVFEFRLETIAKDDPKCPKNWKQRYRGLIWKSDS